MNYRPRLFSLPVILRCRLCLSRKGHYDYGRQGQKKDELWLSQCLACRGTAIEPVPISEVHYVKQKPMWAGHHV